MELSDSHSRARQWLCDQWIRKAATWRPRRKSRWPTSLEQLRAEYGCTRSARWRRDVLQLSERLRGTHGRPPGPFRHHPPAQGRSIAMGRSQLGQPRQCGRCCTASATTIPILWKSERLIQKTSSVLSWRQLMVRRHERAQSRRTSKRRKHVKRRRERKVSGNAGRLSLVPTLDNRKNLCDLWPRAWRSRLDRTRHRFGVLAGRAVGDGAFSAPPTGRQRHDRARKCSHPAVEGRGSRRGSFPRAQLCRGSRSRGNGLTCEEAARLARDADAIRAASPRRSMRSGGCREERAA